MTKKLDLTGKTFGRLTAREEAGRSRAGKVIWTCVCICGKTINTVGSGLLSGNTTSCGCFKIERTKEVVTKHGMSNSHEYQSWFDMKRRCLDPNNDHYEDYAGRGITVHPDFIASFASWYKEIGEKPNDNNKWTVGRIDNNGSYTYGNIRWELNTTQARNHSKQRNNTSGITGVQYSKKDNSWVAQWKPLTGNNKQKYFSVKKFGYEAAKASAIAYRNKMIQELNEQGAGYAESHGKDK